jgi:hypothetical protein
MPPERTQANSRERLHQLDKLPAIARPTVRATAPSYACLLTVSGETRLRPWGLPEI